MRVEFGKKLLKHLKEIVAKEEMEEKQVDKVFLFADHVRTHGLKDLEGRNKNSDEIPEDYPDREKRIETARAKKWWHYHIGIECYNGFIHGDKTSEYIIHYANHSPNYIRLGKLDYHPPFLIPFDEWLVYR